MYLSLLLLSKNETERNNLLFWRNLGVSNHRHLSLYEFHIHCKVSHSTSHMNHFISTLSRVLNESLQPSLVIDWISHRLSRIMNEFHIQLHVSWVNYPTLMSLTSTATCHKRVYELIWNCFLQKWTAVRKTVTKNFEKKQKCPRT